MHSKRMKLTSEYQWQMISLMHEYKKLMLTIFNFILQFLTENI